MECPRCGSMEVVKDGKHFWTTKDGKRHGTQRFLCKRCGKFFSATTSKRAAIIIFVPRAMIANLSFDIRSYLQSHYILRLRKGDITIKEIS